MKCKIKMNERLHAILKESYFNKTNAWFNLDFYTNYDIKFLRWLEQYRVLFTFEGGNAVFVVDGVFEYDNKLKVILNYERSN